MREERDTEEKTNTFLGLVFPCRRAGAAAAVGESVGRAGCLSRFRLFVLQFKRGELL